MSPTERDLRRALRAGEDAGGPDVDTIVAAGEARRARRRVQLASGAGAVALVAAVATGLTLLATGGNDSRRLGEGSSGGGAVASSQRDAGRGSAPGPRASSSTAAGGGTVGSGTTSALACPSAYPRQLTPGGGSPGQFGSDGPLFAEPVASVTVCGYGSGDSPASRPGQVVLHGALARQLAASLEAADTSPGSCPPNASPAARRYAVLATATDGRTERAVTVTLGGSPCHTRITNGTAVRYAWRPPSGLSGILRRLGGTSAPGRLSGSPVRS